MPQPPAGQFSGIFVSYRRDDCAGHAGRLFDKLSNHFGKDRIFMDIDTIEPGEDFVTVIENAVGSCEILIAIIGRSWLSGTTGTTGRLDNPNDFVRVEIATALKRDIRVIPVLVQRASMPKPQDLPDDLVKLSRRHAVELTDLRWQSDVDQLIGVMERVLANGIRSVEGGSGRSWFAESKRALVIGAVISLLVVVVSVGVWLRSGTESTGQGSTRGANMSSSPISSQSPLPTAIQPTKTESPVALQTNTASANKGNANKSVATQSSNGSGRTTKRTQDNSSAQRQKCALAALENRPCRP